MTVKKIKAMLILLAVIFTNSILPVSAGAVPDSVPLMQLKNFLLNTEQTDFDTEFRQVTVFDLIIRKQTVDVLYPDDTGFLHTDGRLLIDSNGEPYTVKGMAFGNCVWDNPPNPVLTHHTESSYAELRELGFNSVRFYLNYRLFEEDTDPYTYKESGFGWLDMNIRWAKKYGMKLVLNMHYPQGGFQSQGNGMDLWLDIENQNRLDALWTEIARRYADEPVILGYGLVNEPVVPIIGTVDESFDQWKNLAQRLADGIRTVDTNHPIFVERLCAIKDTATGNENWGDLNGERNYFLIDGENIVYEFHTYDPFPFTHQDTDWAGTAGAVKTYPNEDEVFGVNSQWAAGVFTGTPADTDSNEWQYLESPKYTVTEESGLKLCGAVFQSQYIGTSGFTYADDIVLKEFDPDGNERIIFSEDFSAGNTGFNYWSDNGKGTGAWANIGKDSSGSLSIFGATGDANFTKSYFIAKPGYSYQACAWVKLDRCLETANVKPRVDFYTADEVHVMNKEYLESCIVSYLQFGIENDVPIYCGEFGAISVSFTKNRGGEAWVTDFLDICKKYDVNWNYHTYHEGGFGLYMNSAYSLPANKNEYLYDVFKKINS
ncbi:MAG: glycoside hydrolase family 5 protein [Oscillospiraceae bacterium]|jgi:endoglucanase|nr:glycoside hydrolase family 5 protein [Oscillospiraceae bacterium]